jgi:hypothetical protein
MTHFITWHTAQPIWPLSLADGGPAPARFRAPALLRFNGDDYMKQLQAALAKTPASLADYIARPESWEQEQAGWLREDEPADTDPLRLFQPAHHRYYLVAASLVCQLPGLPERRINAADRERASFVMRRLFPKAGVTFDENNPATYGEYAWIGTQQRGVWRPVVSPELLPPDEERLALFPKAFSFEGANRTLLAGLIPVARHDIYQAGGADVAAPVPAAQLQADSFSSEAAATAYQTIDKALSELDPARDATGDGETALTDEKSISLAFALLDLADFLKQELGAVWTAFGNGSPAGLTSAQAAVFMHLDATATHTSRRLRDILVAIDGAAYRPQIESGQATSATVAQLLGTSLTRAELGDIAVQLQGGSQLRDRLIAAIDPRSDSFAQDVLAPWTALARPGLSDQAAQDQLLGLLLALSEFLQTELPHVWQALTSGNAGALSSSERAVSDGLAQTALGQSDWKRVLVETDAQRKEILAGHITPSLRVVSERMSAAAIAATVPFASTLGAAIRAALASIPLPSKAQAQAQIASAPPPSPDAPVWYRIRCVYERPKCAPYHDPVVSDPSAPFQLAPFFDAAAPIRPIRIELPKMSLDQLRRCAKGVSIAQPKELRAQVDRARNAGLKDLMDGKVGGGSSFEFGLICSLSIPIITICAFIVLMIFIQLLNIIFHWIPYFILCLPRIGKKG